MGNGCSSLTCAFSVLGAVAVLAALFVILRILPVNAKRRRVGLEPLRWTRIGRSSIGRRELSGASAGSKLDLEDSLRRQMEWEHEQAMNEVVRYGRGMTRWHCQEHDRHCLRPSEEGHPSGGFDNPAVPTDWPPDLTKG